MFEKLKQKSEMLDAERRDRNFSREQVASTSASHPSSMDRSMQIVEQRSDLLRWEQEFGEEFELFVRNLRNEEFTEDGWRPISRTTYVNGVPTTVTMEPDFNDLFVQRLKHYAQPFMMKQVAISKMDEKRILLMLKRTSHALTQDLAIHMDDYGIKDLATATRIKRAFLQFVAPNFYRSVGGWNKEQSSKIWNRSEVVTNPEPEKKKFFGMFGG